MKKALITGITGQDGSYLAEFLLEKGYDVHGLVRRSSTSNTKHIDHLRPYLEERLFLHHGDVTDSANLIGLLDTIRPDEIYHLAAQSHAHVSFDLPEYTADVNGLGTLRVLNAIHQSGISNRARLYQAGAAEMFGKVLTAVHESGVPAKFYQASSSEMFGQVREIPQRETTEFYPRSPYGVAKVFAHWSTINYRESYGLFACNGIAFNHESPRRHETFVTRKITRAVARIALIKAGRRDKLYLGNLDACRDWGYAKEYVEAMWLMLQQDEPDDYVIATGEAHSVRELVELAFGYVDLDWHDHVVIDPKFYRPAEVAFLVGDASKLKQRTGWAPKTKFHDLVRLMMDADLALESKE